MSIKPKPIKFLLRMEKQTYEQISKLADKYNVSLNSEINTLLQCCIKRWNTKTIKIRDIPTHLQQLQDDDKNWEQEYNEIMKEMGKAN